MKTEVRCLFSGLTAFGRWVGNLLCTTLYKYILQIQSAPEKTPYKEMCDFLTLKCYHCLWHWSKQNLPSFGQNSHFTWEFRVFDAWREFSIETGQFLTNGSKRWRFFVLINARANGNIFRVKKSNISLRDIFFDSPCSIPESNYKIS